MYNTQLPNIIHNNTINKPIDRLPSGEYIGTLDVSYVDDGTVLAIINSAPWPTFFDKWRVGPPPYSVEWRRARAGLFQTLEAQQLISKLQAKGLATVLKNIPVKFWIKEVSGYKIVNYNNSYMATVDNQSVSGWKPTITEVERDMRSVSIPTVFYNLSDIMALKDLTNGLKERVHDYLKNKQHASIDNNTPTLR